MFCLKIKNQLRNFYRLFDRSVDEYINIALSITKALKDIVQSPAAAVLTAIIPGTLDDRLKAQAEHALEQAVKALTIAGKCSDSKSLTEYINCFATELRKQDERLRDALLLKLASLITAELDGRRLKAHHYDLFTQAKYTVGK